MIAQALSAVAHKALEGATVAYVAAPGLDTIQAIDVSDKSNISITGTYTNGTYIDGPNDLALDVDRNILYATSSADNEVTALDVSDPSNITRLGGLTNSTYMDDPKKLALDVHRQRLYVGSEDTMEVSVFDVSTAGTFTYKANYTSTATLGSAGGIRRLHLDTTNNLIFVRNRTDQSLTILDVSGDTSISLSQELDGNAKLEGAYGNAMVPDPAKKILWFLGSGTANARFLSAWDYSDPTDIQELTKYRVDYTTGTANAYWATWDQIRNRLYVSGTTSGTTYLNGFYDLNTIPPTFTAPSSTSAGFGGQDDVVLDPVNQMLYLADNNADLLRCYDISGDDIVQTDTIGNSSTLDFATGVVVNVKGPASTHAYSSTDYQL